MAHDKGKSFDEFAAAISEEENPERLEKLLDELLGILAEQARPIPGPEDQKTVHSVIRSWRFI